MNRTLAQVEAELGRLQNAPGSSTFSGRNRTEQLQNEVTRLRRFETGADTQLGSTRTQTNPDTIAKMVREALRRTGDSAMIAASTAASDEACVYLYRMLKV